MFVAAELIRPLDAHAGGVDSNDFVEADKVEALYKGKGTKWFSGKISRVNHDGTYDVRYDDGDSEAGALNSNLRRHPDASPAKVSLREGMKVEARFRGKERYYPGVIRRENRDGTFDIDYNDVRSNGSSTPLV